MNNAKPINNTERGFMTLVNSLTEQRVISWRREGTELRAVVQLRLEVHDVPENANDPDSDQLRTMVIDGGNPETHCIDPVPVELLVEQFAELEHLAETGNDAVVRAGHARRKTPEK